MARWCSVGCVQSDTYSASFPGYYPHRNLCKFCTSIPVHGTSEFCTPVAQYSGDGYALLKIPGCGYGHGYNIRIPTRNFCEF